MLSLPNPLIHVDAAKTEVPCDTLIEAATFKLLNSLRTPQPITAAVIHNAFDDNEVEKMLAVNEDPDKAAQYIASYLAPVNRVYQAWWAKDPNSLHFSLKPLASDGFSTEPSVQRHFDQQFSGDGYPQYGALSATATALGEVTYIFGQHPFDPFDPASRDDFQARRSDLTRNPDPNEVPITAKSKTLVLIPTHTLHGGEATEGRVTQVDFSYLEPIRTVE